jgi:CxxC motif-containing protein (DUF1111 family)
VNNRYKLGPVAAHGIFLSAILFSTSAFAQTDPGVQGGAARAGSPLPGLTANEAIFFDVGRDDFNEAEGIADGLGPRFNLDGCGGCHFQPAAGGSSGTVNPQIPDGGVHALFTISQRNDGTGSASACNIVQDNFAAEAANNNLIFRIPTPVFGMGLMENITDSELNRNLTEGAGARAQLGINGRLNHNGNDGRVTRFGWKAQNISALVFSGEAYNVEMGITNENFQIERDETQACQFAQLPNDVSNTDGATGTDTISAIEKFSFFMRFLAPPTQSTTTPGGNASIAEGFNAFVNIGCTHCHTQQLRTGNTTVAALRNQNVRLFSDIALHNMGPGLADDIRQGEATGDEFRTAPLWGLGQRVFFLHDGRTNNLLTAIQAHRSNANGTYPASEANAVIDRFNALSATAKQNMLNFLRSL